MTVSKSLIITIGIITASILSNSAQALDAAGLYRERACIACHGEEGRVPVMAEYPKIAGQNAPYILAQMKDIKSGVRNNTHAVAMKNMMHLISDEEMAIVAEWLAELPK
ncbi:MAG: c-type cytochrome [Candidatus Thiodiazotropha sp. (ex Lucinoma annulata)]|nr:c-type cytochrome [Candidatus Thiodiazotropha sp. (ex Lucinoma annulata)]